ncbi:MAG: LON peptidase substrate-binding domain-containing protein [Opitutaceae bacterium]
MQLRPPAEVPVMTLPNTVFFPGIALPLHIFEPRYRTMLTHVLRSHRMFAVAALNRKKVAFPAAPEPLHEIASVGIVRASRKSADGTSDLVLEGIARVRVTDIVREAPYRVIAIEALSSQSAEPEHELRGLRSDLLETVRLRAKFPMPMPPHFERMLQKVEDPSEICDITVFALLDGFSFKQRMLELLDPAERLRQTIAQLRRELKHYEFEKRLSDCSDDPDAGKN